MKTKRKILMLAVLLAGGHQLASAQSVEPYNYCSGISPSPEMFAIGRHGGVTPSLYTGAMEYSVPLFTYSDEDFTLPMSLDYHFDGYRPAEHSGMVGYGWSLNCGGVITREVRGLPDEEDGADTCLSGYFHYADSYMPNYQNRVVVNSQLQSYFPVISDFEVARNSNVFADLPTYSTLNMTYGQGDKFDTAADLFHFNFLGHTGSFMMLEDGTFKAFDTSDPYGEISVDYETIPNYDDNMVRLCRFTIRTGDGYQYVFGSSEASTEHYVSFCNSSLSVTISAWKLDTIIAPNGNRISLNYSNDKQRSIDISYVYTPDIYIQSGTYHTPSNRFGTNQSAKKKSICSRVWSPLESVSVNGSTVIELDYEDKDYDECSTTHYEGTNSFGRETMPIGLWTKLDDPTSLSGITVRNRNNSVIRTFTLSQTYSMNKYFLRQLYDSKNGCYSFNYNTPGYSTTPSNNTNRLDYWGYYNGIETSDIRTNLQEQPGMLATGSHYDQLFIASLQPREQESSLCALTSISYPTGGSTAIEYEGNDASFFLERSLSFSPYFIGNSANYAAGGIRVKKITDNDGSAQYEEEYLYQNSITDTASSGYVLDTRCFGLSVSLNYSMSFIQDGTRYFGDVDLFTRGYTSECNLYQTSSPHIGYKTVLVKHPDQSWTEYDFAIGPNYLDGYSQDDVTSIQKTFLGTTDSIHGYAGQETGLYNLLLPPIDDNSCMRGKLLREVIYDAEGHTMREYTYQYEKELVCETTACYNMLINFAEITQKHYQCLGTSELEKEFFGNDVIVRSKSREYNQFGQIVSESAISGGDGIQMHYWYNHNGTAGDYMSLKSDIVKTRITNGLKYVIGSEHYAYGAGGGGYKPTETASYICTPTQYFGSSPLVSTGRTAGSRVTTLTYDPTYRRLMTVTMPGGAYVRYSWDRTYDHLTGKTVNGDGNTFSYQWKDQVGLTRLTEPSGLYHTYTYDTKNRLKYIEDVNGEDEIMYDYNVEVSSPEPQYNPHPGNWIQRTTYMSHPENSSFVDITYYDGLGYPNQTVSGKAGGTASAPNLVTPIVYDCMRRADAVSYLPFATSEGMSSKVSNAVSKQTQFYSSLYAGETRAFAEKVYETSPAARPLSATREGREWNGHPVTIDYAVNGSEDNVMKFTYNHTLQKVMRNGAYGSDVLLKTTSINEDGQKSVVFTDAWGKVICSRLFPNDDTIIETSYIYDLKDSLVCVIQPKGMDSLRSGTAANDIPLDGAFARANCFTYLRDALGRVKRSIVPGGPVTEYAYDSRNRVRLMSTEKMKDGPSSCKYMMNIYDPYDNLVMQGLVKFSGQNLEQVRNSLDLDTIPGYSMLRVLYNATYYTFTDVAQSVSGLPFDDGVDNDISSYISYTGHRGLLKSETIYDVNGITDNYSAANVTRNRAYYYDEKGRVIQMRESDSDGHSATYSKFYDLAGNITASIEQHNTPGNVTHILRTDYIRDARGRVTSCARTFDGNRLADITYSYDALGRLALKEGGPTLSESCTYDLHGWTTGIEAGTGTNTLFSESIRYASPQKPDAVPLYSGIISEIASLQYGGSLNTYSYSYDGSSRLIDARHFIGNSSAISNTDTERSVSYDANGNITALTRYGATNAGSSVLGFSYTGNRMTGAVNSVNQNSFSFGYDADGNRTSDGRTGLEFSYNILNLPCEVQDGQQNMKMRYTYLSDGTKISALDAAGNGLFYRGNFVYEKAGSTISLESVATDEGRLAISAGSTIQDQWHVKDHLGNVRSVVWLNAQSGTGISARILEQNDYLPFGTKAVNGSQPGLSTNRYRYAGKEEQRFASFNSQILDFGARSYDPFTCRWTSTDPLAYKYFGLSPYNYCGNDPVNRFDPDGRWDVTIHLYIDRTVNGYGYASVTDINGKEVFRFTVRTEGVKGHDRTKEGGDTPLGTYDIPDKKPWIDGGDRQAYGPNSRLNMEPESGEIVDTNRDQIRIHGGRQEIFDEDMNSWTPVKDPVLKKTFGCIRAYDKDMKTFKEKTKDLQDTNKGEYPGKVFIIDDLENQEYDVRK